MARTLGIFSVGQHSAASIAAHSLHALDRPLHIGAELWVAVATDAAAVLGAFTRGAGLPPSWRLVRRGSGGPVVHVGPGTIHVALSSVDPSVPFGADSRRIVNRSVRPLLRALTSFTPGAYYFGRDWVAVTHRPTAWVGFGHDASTGRTLFEAFVAVSVPWATERTSAFRGREPTTLDAIAGRALDPTAVAGAIVESYVKGSNSTAVDLEAEALTLGEPGSDPSADVPWVATGEEAIGALGAGPDADGTFRIGGDLMVSRDALWRLERRVGNAGTEEDIARAVNEELGAPGVALEGVRTLESLADVIARARGFDRQPNRSRSFPMNERR